MTSRGARTWVVATSNPAKVREIREILSELDVECVGLEGLPPIMFPDEGDDYAENAARKARSAAEQLGRVAVADDSGLEVAGLDGGPGPLSARYGGPALDDSGRVQCGRPFRGRLLVGRLLWSTSGAQDQEDRQHAWSCSFHGYLPMTILALSTRGETFVAPRRIECR